MTFLPHIHLILLIAGFLIVQDYGISIVLGQISGQDVHGVGVPPVHNPAPAGNPPGQPSMVVHDPRVAEGTKINQENQNIPNQPHVLHAAASNVPNAPPSQQIHQQAVPGVGINNPDPSMYIQTGGAPVQVPMGHGSNPQVVNQANPSPIQTNFANQPPPPVMQAQNFAADHPQGVPPSSQQGSVPQFQGNFQGQPNQMQPGQIIDDQQNQIPPGHHNQIPSHPNQVPPGHPNQIPPGHPNQIPPGHSNQIPPGHPNQIPPGHLNQIPPGHPNQIPPGHPSHVPPGHPSQVPHGQPQPPLSHIPQGQPPIPPLDGNIPMHGNVPPPQMSDQFFQHPPVQSVHQPPPNAAGVRFEGDQVAAVRHHPDSNLNQFHGGLHDQAPDVYNQFRHNHESVDPSRTPRSQDENQPDEYASLTIIIPPGSKNCYFYTPLMDFVVYYQVFFY
ncbi:unnamed protein product [Echinostoma caproni]|uniref:Sporozoite surface protein 2-like n=1 Tax=Echinostoma caproni TaxID=27848 RepID=A0A183AZV5_9TREM|nr:unnamed protein product [Echinostoma caproni]